MSFHHLDEWFDLGYKVAENKHTLTRNESIMLGIEDTWMWAFNLGRRYYDFTLTVQ